MRRRPRPASAPARRGPRRRRAPEAFESVDPGLGKIGALQPLGGGRLRLFTARCEVWETDFGGAPVRREVLPGHFVLCNDAEEQAYQQKAKELDEKKEKTK